MAFKVIETQEELDKIISERLGREKAKTEAQYAGFEDFKTKAAKYDEMAGKDYEGQISKLTEELNKAKETLSGNAQALAEMTKRAESAERTNLINKVALESGLPADLASRLRGDTEDDLRKDAETLAAYTKGHAVPLRSTEQMPTNDKDAALKSVLDSLTKG